MSGPAKALLFLLLPACLINTELYEQRLDELTDDDGDGFREDDGDCNDNRPDVYPKAPEICDGRDNDCNGKEDDKPVSAWYLDADNDGHGDPSTAQHVCRQPEGHVAQGDDCDDANAEAFPGLNERCDGWDNDCNREIDEASAVDARTWYPDEDGDGFGDPAYEIRACDPPTADSVEQGGDCDDADDQSWPDAPELCDGRDNDCDGAADEPPVSGSGSWYRDQDGDGFGDDTRTSCTGGEGYVTVAGDCGDADPDVHPDAEEVCNDGLDNDCDGGPGECTWPGEVDMTDEIILSGDYELEGFAVRGAPGDLDGDGKAEILLSSFSYLPSEDAYLSELLGFEGPLVASASRSSATLAISDEVYNQGFGWGVAIADLDGDGYDDLVTSDFQQTVSGRALAGEIYLLHGPISTSGIGSAMADWTIQGTQAEDWLGDTLNTVGDINGDGRIDFAASNIRHDHGAEYGGVVWLFTTPGSGTTSAGAATAFLYGTETSERFGKGFTGADLDADGLSDLVVGSPQMTLSKGGLRIFLGPVSGTLASGSADVSFVGESTSSSTGSTVDRLGDVNGDGIEDVVVGAPYTGEGAAYILWGSSSLSDGYLADAPVKLRGDASNAFNFGYTVANVADLDGDGSTDIAVGDSSPSAANAFVFFGPFDTAGTRSSAAADVVLTGNGTNDREYTLLLGPGDITGDAAPDLVVGSPWASTTTGVAYIIPGTGF